jgi:hypothetical protein
MILRAFAILFCLALGAGPAAAVSPLVRLPRLGGGPMSRFARWPVRRAVLAAILGLVLPLAAPALADDDWQTFSDSVVGVSTSMPGSPTGRSDGPDGASVFQAMLETPDGRGYLLRVDEVPGGTTASPLAALNRLVDLVATPARGSVVYRGETTVGGRPAADIVLGPDADGDYLRGRLIVGNGKLVQLLVGRHGAAPALDRFYTDFRFLP